MVTEVIPGPHAQSNPGGQGPLHPDSSRRRDEHQRSRQFRHHDRPPGRCPPLCANHLRAGQHRQWRPGGVSPHLRRFQVHRAGVEGCLHGLPAPTAAAAAAAASSALFGGRAAAAAAGRRRRRRRWKTPGATAVHVNAVSDDENNAVLVSAPADFMPGISNIIVKLDIPQEDTIIIRLFTLRNADCNDVTDRTARPVPGSKHRSQRQTPGEAGAPPHSSPAAGAAAPAPLPQRA